MIVYIAPERKKIPDARRKQLMLSRLSPSDIIIDLQDGGTETYQDMIDRRATVRQIEAATGYTPSQQALIEGNPIDWTDDVYVRNSYKVCISERLFTDAIEKWYFDSEEEAISFYERLKTRMASGLSAAQISGNGDIFQMQSLPDLTNI